MQPDTADVVIVGAGIAGASLACELGRTHAVVLLETEDQPGFHATGRSAAFFLESYGNDAIQALTRASRSFFEQPPANFCDGPLLTPQDCVILAAPGEEHELHERYAEMRSSSAALSIESADFALERVPVLRRSEVAACLWEAGSQRIDVHRLLQGYLRGFRRNGGRLVTGAQLMHARWDCDAWSIETPAGQFRAHVLVNAAGAWADEVAERAGATPLGLQPLRRTACLVETATPIDCRAWAAVTDLRESFYFMPEAGQLLLSPADETPMPAGDAFAEDIDVALAVDRFETVTTASVRRVSHQWAGLRTFAADRTPIVGFDPGCDGFFWLAGQGGYGIQTAPALARLAGECLTRRPQRGASAAAGVTAKSLSPARLTVR